MSIIGFKDTMGENKSVIADMVNAYTKDLYTYALKKMPDAHLAEDMVQNTFMAALTSYDKFQHKSAPKTWLMSILKNKITDHYRKAYKRNETSIHSENEMFDQNGNWLPASIPAHWETGHLLDDLNFKKVFYNCINNLPEHWNSAIQMKYLNTELTPEDVGISRTNYWKMLERARRQLRTCLDQNWFKNN